MKLFRWLRRLPLALIIGVVGVVGVVALVTLKPRPEPRPEPDPPKPVVEVVRAAPEDRALSVTTQGEVAPRRDIQLVSQVGGQIVATADDFVDGGRFEKGDWLVRLDRRDYQNARARAEAQLREAERVLAEERGRARQARREWQDLGNEQANALFLRKPQLAAAEASVAAARAELDQAELDLERTEVRAPFDGRIRQTQANLGQFISPGTAVADIYDDAVAQIRLPLTDDQAALLDLPLGRDSESQKSGAAVTLTGRVLGEHHQWSGRLARTEASLDPQSRVLHAVVEVPEPFNTDRHPAPLLIGAFVEARIEGRKLKDVIALPRTAVFDGDRLYSVDDKGEVQFKRVRVLKVDGEQLWVRGDLSEGEPVIVDRQGYVSPGTAVRLADEVEASEQPPEADAASGSADDAEGEA